MERRLGRRTSATAFVVARDDRSRGEQPVWVGGSVAGRATRSLKYWGNAAARRGRQRQLRRSLPSNGLDATGTGKSAEIGREIDLVVSVRQFRAIDVSIVAGIFRPGAGTARPVEPVRYWKPEVRLFF